MEQQTTTTKYDWGKGKVNKYYNRNINQMQPNTIEAPVMELPEQSKATIEDQIRGYLNPAYEKAIQSLKKQKDYSRRYIDYDPNSRAATSNDSEPASESAWYRNAKRNLDIGETYARSSVSNNYLSNVAKNTAEQYDRYLTRKAQYDSQNASNALEADVFNAKVKDALEQMIYERSIMRSRGKF